MERVEIETRINTVLHDEFEVPKELLVKESEIKEKMGLDSLDAVDLLVLLEEEMDVEVDPQQFMECRTLGDVYDVVNTLVEKAQ